MDLVGRTLHPRGVGTRGADEEHRWWWKEIRGQSVGLDEPGVNFGDELAGLSGGEDGCMGWEGGDGGTAGGGSGEGREEATGGGAEHGEGQEGKRKGGGAGSRGENGERAI